MTDREPWALCGHERPQLPAGSARMCDADECFSWGVSTGTGWVPPTTQQMTDITLIMWEDTIFAKAFSIVHGEPRGVARYRYLRYGGEPA